MSIKSVPGQEGTLNIFKQEKISTTVQCYELFLDRTLLFPIHLLNPPLSSRRT